MKRVLLTTIAALALAACQEPTLVPQPMGSTAEFNTSSLEETRVEGSTWQSDDRVGIYAASTKPTNQIYYSNIEHYATPTSNGATLKAVDCTAPILYDYATTANFVAYYPYNATNSATEVAIDIQDQTKADLLISDVVMGTEGGAAVNFNFSHALAKFQLTLNTEEELANVSIIVYPARTTAIIDPYTRTITNQAATPRIGTNIGGIELSRSSASSNIYEAILIPSDESLGDEQIQIIISIQTDGGQTTIEHTAQCTLKAGYNHTYELTIIGKSNVAQTPATTSSRWIPKDYIPLEGIN